MAQPDLHPVTLRFRSNELEHAFRIDNTERMVRYVRWPLMLGAILYASYGFIDASVVPAHAGEAWLMRLGVTGFITAVVIRMWWPVSRTTLSALYSAVALLAGAGLLVETWWWADVGRLTTHTGVIILLIYIHVLSRMPFVLVTALGWIISVGYLLVLARHPLATGLDVSEHAAAIVSANLTGMVASYVLERYARRVFAQQRTLEAGRLELEQQAGTLRETNDYLASAIADLQQAQQRLIQQEKLASLGSLTAGIAHEIKNPLNFVNNFAGLNEELVGELRAAISRGDGSLDGSTAELLDQLETNAQRIQVHGRRADGIVRSMLAHSRRESGARTRADFNAVVDEHVGLAYHAFRAREGSIQPVLERRMADDVGSVRMDAQEIGRVVINLAGNAFDAVAARTGGEAGFVPTVIVETWRVEGEVVLRMIDNGRGIAREVQGRVFEPFFTTKPAGEGTGLGLSLAHEIVRDHGGTIEIESPEGQGATFVVRLPA